MVRGTSVMPARDRVPPVSTQAHSSAAQAVPCESLENTVVGSPSQALGPDQFQSLPPTMEETSPETGVPHGADPRVMGSRKVGQSPQPLPAGWYAYATKFAAVTSRCPDRSPLMPMLCAPSCARAPRYGAGTNVRPSFDWNTSTLALGEKRSTVVTATKVESASTYFTSAESCAAWSRVMAWPWSARCAGQSSAVASSTVARSVNCAAWSSE